MSYVLRRSLVSFMKIINNYMKPVSVSRTLTTSSTLADNYEGDGKTTVTILNREHKHLIMIDTYNNYGFRLNNGIFAVGPLAVFPKTILQWNVNDVKELTAESLSLFCLLEPKIDILIIGTGEKRMLPSKDVLKYLKSNGISAEILPTDQACSTFNFLNAEGRCIAGALIPPENVTVYDEELKILDNVEAIDDHSSPPYPKTVK